MEIYTVNLERAVNAQWKKDMDQKAELARKQWWNDILPAKIYDLPVHDEEMEGGDDFDAGGGGDYGGGMDNHHDNNDAFNMGTQSYGIRANKKKPKVKQGFFNKLFSSS
jgi:hypothetical protein